MSCLGRTLGAGSFTQTPWPRWAVFTEHDMGRVSAFLDVWCNLEQARASSCKHEAESNIEVRGSAETVSETLFAVVTPVIPHVALWARPRSLWTHRPCNVATASGMAAGSECKLTRKRGPFKEALLKRPSDLVAFWAHLQSASRASC